MVVYSQLLAVSSEGMPSPFHCEDRHDKKPDSGVADKIRDKKIDIGAVIGHI